MGKGDSPPPAKGVRVVSDQLDSASTNRHQ